MDYTAHFLDGTCFDISFLQIEARNEFLFRMLQDKHTSIEQLFDKIENQFHNIVLVEK